jgi:hypothetical protein
MHGPIINLCSLFHARHRVLINLSPRPHEFVDFLDPNTQQLWRFTIPFSLIVASSDKQFCSLLILAYLVLKPLAQLHYSLTIVFILVCTLLFILLGARELFQHRGSWRGLDPSWPQICHQFVQLLICCKFTPPLIGTIGG